ncbi:MAG: AAA family ATPase [Methylococcaceae bacterium]
MTELSFTQIEIDGFRGLRLLNLEDLGRINILVGRNNSGKTSVLEALSILCQPQNPDEWLSMVSRRDFGGFDETIVQSLRWCFTQEIISDYETLIEAKCKFKCNGNFPLRELEIEYNEFIGEPSPEEIRRSFIKDKTMDSRIMRGADLTFISSLLNNQLNLFLDNKKITTLRIWEDLPIRRRYSKNIGVNSKTLTPYSYQLNRNQLQLQSKYLFDKSSNVLELLKDFDVDIQGIDIASFSGGLAAIYIKHRKLGIAPLSVFGDATRRAVLLATTLLSLEEGGILLIDEIEVGIHVSALTAVFQWLVKAARELKIQLFITTHSLEALDAIISNYSLQNADDIVAFHLSQAPEKTQCKRFSSDLLHRLRFERGLDVR